MQRKDCVPIKYCRLCNSRKLKKVFDLGNTPLANSYSSEKVSKKLKKYPLKLNLCNNCGHLQLLDIIDPEYIFDNYTYSTGTSKGLVNHFKEYAEYIINNYKLDQGSKILDIGSNDGTLLRFFKEHNFTVLGIDPAADIAAKATKSGIMTYPDFISKKLCQKIVTLESRLKLL